MITVSSGFLLRAVLAVVVAPVVASGADLMRYELFPTGHGEAGRLLETPTGELLISIGNTSPASLSGASGLYRLSPDGTITDRIVLPANLHSFTPFADGFLATRASGPRDEYGLSRYQVLTFDGRSADSARVVYETDPDVNAIHTEPSLTHDAVYVVTDLKRYRFVARRIDAAGAVNWRVEFENAQFIDVVSIPGGVAVFYYPQRSGKPGLLPVQIAALSDSGSLRWRSSYARPQSMAIESLAFQPPDHLVGLQIPASLNEPWRLLRIDVDDGSNLGTTDVPPASHMRPTPVGLLLTDDLVQQPYAALLRRDGSVAWWRRFPIHREHGGRLVDATITPAGQLLMLGQYAVPRDRRQNLWDSSVLLLSTDAHRPAATPECLDVDPADIVKLQRRIEFGHAIAVSVTRGIASYAVSNQPCRPPSDQAYLRFLRELDASLGPQATQPPRWDLRVFIDVRDVERPYSLTGYGMNTGMLHGPRTSFRYSANPDAARTMKAHLDAKVWPHLRSMEALQERFRQLTGHRLMIQLHEPKLSDVEIFRQLEAAAATVIAAVEQIPSGQLRDPREAARRELYPRLEVDGFGNHDDVRSLNDVRRTVRKMFYVDE